MKYRQLIEILKQEYPIESAEEWDKVGIHFGHPDEEVAKIMVALDIRPGVVSEAIEKHVDTIVVHHPPLFNSIDTFDYSNPEIDMYRHIIQNDIKIYAMHTNVDKEINGMNDWLAEELLLKDIECLESELLEEQVCLGRIGKLNEPMNRVQVLNHIKSRLLSPKLTVIEKEPKEFYQTIAIVGGAAFESIFDAVYRQADIFITGDITYHKGHTAFEQPLMTVDPGHYIEHIFIEKMADKLRTKVKLDIIESNTNTNPFTYY